MSCAVARLAGIMAAKKTADLIPLCHPLPITKVALDLTPDSDLPGIRIAATVKTSGQTGVEMEALTAVSVAALTVYDMVKAVERSMADRRDPSGRQRWRQIRPLRGRVMISVEDALRHCLAMAAPLPAETVPLAQAAGRWMCAPAVATRDQPPFAASAMDGYAVQGDPWPATALPWWARLGPAMPSPALWRRARRCASSPARRCLMGPPGWSFRRTWTVSATGSP